MILGRPLLSRTQTGRRHRRFEGILYFASRILYDHEAGLPSKLDSVPVSWKIQRWDREAATLTFSPGLLRSGSH